MPHLVLMGRTPINVTRLHVNLLPEDLPLIDGVVSAAADVIVRDDLSSTRETEMRATNDITRAKTIEQAKSELIDNMRVAVAGINMLTENLEKMRAAMDADRRSLQ